MRIVWPLLVSAVTLISSSVSHSQGSSAYCQPRDAGSAVDAAGRRHSAAEYPGKRPPWADDIVQAFAPEYRFRDRFLRHEGVGVFRLTLDQPTGRVTKVTTLKSTGFATLDDSAASAFRRFQWKPRLWREIVMPVGFQMTAGLSRRLPPGAIPLPTGHEHDNYLYHFQSRDSDMPR
jgi:TonB family protein